MFQRPNRLAVAGLALGGLMGSEFWLRFHVNAFGLVALGYLVCAILLFFGAQGTENHGSRSALRGLLRTMKDPFVRSLAPVWLCVNAVAGLWLGPTLPFLPARKTQGGQYLDGIFAGDPAQASVRRNGPFKSIVRSQNYLTTSKQPC